MSKIKESVKSMCDSMINEPRILIYDNKKISYIVGSFGFTDIKTPEPIDITCVGDTDKRYAPPMVATLTCTIANYERLDNIELDETTMKRIAKYNKETDIKKLDEVIKRKKEEIKELDDILCDKNKRVEKLKEFVANIYNIDISDDDYY